MRTIAIVAALVALASPSFAQRHKVDFDPESKAGYLIQQIQQESDDGARLRLLEQFASEFPSHASIAWIYELLQPYYLAAKQFDKLLAVCPKALAADPSDVVTAQNCLEAASAQQDPQIIVRYAGTAWRAASKAAQSAAQPEDAAYAKRLMASAEYALFSLANKADDPQKRLEYLRILSDCNPHSEYLAKNGDLETFRSYQQMGRVEKAIELAPQILAHDPRNIDVLVAVAEYHFKKENAPETVLSACQKLIEILSNPSRPADFDGGNWEQKRSQYLGGAYYMSGFVASTHGKFALADKRLRAALPFIRSKPEILAPALYHLGYANYRLAQSQSERIRIHDAIKFTEECATFEGPYQEQAAKNVGIMKSEFNLP